MPANVTAGGLHHINNVCSTHGDGFAWFACHSLWQRHVLLKPETKPKQHGNVMQIFYGKGVQEVCFCVHNNRLLGQMLESVSAEMC